MTHPEALPDLVQTREDIRHDATSAAAVIEQCIARAQGPANRHALLREMFDSARTEAAAAGPASALAGLPVTVKDLFDIAGQTTAAGSRVLRDAPPALADAPAVARLRAAGGAVLGRSHMVEFAFSGIGWNPHGPMPVNPADAATPRIPGGSSSGAAVSVATGAAYLGLGSDTGGSIRIPAALCGIVGFKSTARLVPTEGALPLSSTLDTVCAMTRSVRDAIVAHEVLSDSTVMRSPAPLSQYRLAVARTTMLEGLDATVARAFDRSLQRLRAAGAHIDELALDEIRDLGSIQSQGGFAAAEAYAWHRRLLAQHAELYDPRVRVRIERGAPMSAADYLDLFAQRREWIARVLARLQGYDAVLSPTVAIVAPPLVEAVASDEVFARVNALVLRNTSVVNMLDGCAISIPCHAAGELPVGLMLWHGALHDERVLNIAVQAERALAAA